MERICSPTSSLVFVFAESQGKLRVCTDNERPACGSAGHAPFLLVHSIQHRMTSSIFDARDNEERRVSRTILLSAPAAVSGKAAAPLAASGLAARDSCSLLSDSPGGYSCARALHDAVDVATALAPTRAPAQGRSRLVPRFLHASKGRELHIGALPAVKACKCVGHAHETICMGPIL
eukprot:6214712-Pleurochrysis_carterae.AAC.3